MKPAIFSILWGLALAAVPAVAAAAQPMPFDHVHIAVPDVKLAVEWYRRHVGGERIAGEPNNRLMVGETRVVFLENKAPRSTRGGAIDHVGFGNGDVSAAAAAIIADGGSRLAEPSAIPGAVILHDPWGTRIELVPAQAIGVHHVHLGSAVPKSDARWYRRIFGGEDARLGKTVAVRFGSVLLAIDKANGGASEGSAHDHIGWRVADLDPMIAILRAGDTRMLSGIEARGATTRIIFVAGPSGTKIELLQR